MMSLRASMLLATLALFATHDDASAKQEKKHHTFHGTVVHVHHGKDKHHGSITVKHHSGKGDAVTKTFHINESTQIHGSDKKGATKLHKGEHVAIRHTGHHADDIKIGHGKKK